MIETYRGYNIWHNTQTVWHKNPVSGHEWSTQVPLKTFYISRGPAADVLQTFHSVISCKEHIDFLIKHVVQ